MTTLSALAFITDALRESVLRGPIELQQSSDHLTLLQAPSALFKVITYVWPVLIALMVWVCYGVFTGGPSTKLTCNRATGVCTLSGGSRARVPNLADITGVELEMKYAHKEGDAHYVTLLLRDGTKQRISPQGAIAPGAVAEYRAAVESIRAFLDDSSRPDLDASFTFRASTVQKIRNVTFLIFTIAVMFLLLGTYSTRSFAFDRGVGKLTVTRSAPLRSSTQELALDQIAAVDQRGTTVELTLKDGTKVEVAVPKDADRADVIVRGVRALTAK